MEFVRVANVRVVQIRAIQSCVIKLRAGVESIQTSNCTTMAIQTDTREGADVEPNRQSQRQRRPDREPSVTRLLVSVRSLTEFETVVGLEVDLIDLKEPNHGSLAPTSCSLWHTVADHRSVGRGGHQLSIALGDAADGAALGGEVPPRATYAKLGFARCPTLARVEKLYQTFRSALPSSVSAVAVAYADHEAAGCPSPDEFIAAAKSIGLQHLLIDTFGKNDRWWTLQDGDERWQRYVASARRAGLSIAMAGKLTQSDLRLIASGNVAKPDIVGVRSAVCDGQRTDNLSSQRVRSAIASVRKPTAATG